MTEIIQKYYNEAKKVIWENQGITSYELLSKMIEKGNGYVIQGNYTYKEILGLLKEDKYVRYDKDTDKLYSYKELDIKVLTQDTKKKESCKGCLFCIKAGDMNSEYINREKKAEKLKKEYFDGVCLLNPNLKLNQYGNVSNECPYNKAFDSILEEKE